MPDSYTEDLRDVAIAAAQVANYCDHADHNEPVDRSWVLGASETLKSVAVRIAEREGVDLFELYAERVASIESRNVADTNDAYDGAEAVRAASSWRELQLAQLGHDRYFHPDVLGLHKSEQLLHYALHLSKLAGALAEEPSLSDQHADFLARRLPDLLLFSLKLASVMGQKLPETALNHGHEFAAQPAVLVGP